MSVKALWRGQPPPKKETAHRLRAGDVEASAATLGSFAGTDRKKVHYYLHPVVCHDVDRRMMMVYLDRLATYQVAARDERP
jgi:hypothetical protein